MHDDGRVKFHVHRSERHRRRRGLAPWNNGVIAACCCCCCCCLHSLGGLIGAVTFNAKPEAEVDARPLYWRCLGAMTLVAAALCSFGDEPTIAIVVLVLGMPAIQLAASVISLIAVGLLYDSTGAAVARGQIGRMTLRTLVGTLVGIAVMFGAGLVLSAL